MISAINYSEDEDNIEYQTLSREAERKPLLSYATEKNYSFAAKFDQEQNQNQHAKLPNLSLLRNNSTPPPSPLFFKNVQIAPINPENSGKFFSLSKLWKFSGPGLLISVAYLDPGNLDIDIQSGAIAGYKLLWVLMYSTLAGFLIQFLSVRLGSATGFHLAEICQREYGVFTRYFLWIMLEISIIASDIQQVIGSALALNILSNGNIPMWVAILITTSDVFLFLLLETTGIRVLEMIFALFITVLGGSFLYMYIRVQPDQIRVLEGLVIPWCSNCSYIEVNQLIGIVGSIVMPHNIYFHSSLVLSRNFERNELAIHEANKYYAIESGFALILAFVINLFVTSVSAKSFNSNPDTQNITLFNAANFISQEYGLSMKVIWAIGLLSAGQCSTISGTYAGQFIMQGLTKINLTKWMRIIITRSISIIPCLLITLLAYEDIMHLSLWCNIISAIQLPFALLPILHFTSSKRIMGSFKNGAILKITCYSITCCILCLNIYFIVNFIIKTKLLTSYILGSIFIIYAVFVTIFLLGVNNIYRIKLLFRRIFCAYNAFEIDELLHTNPTYRRPDRAPNVSTLPNSPLSSLNASTTNRLSSLKNFLRGKSSNEGMITSSKYTILNNEPVSVTSDDYAVPII